MDTLQFLIHSTYSSDGRSNECVIIETNEFGPSLYALLRILESSDEVKYFTVRRKARGHWLKPIDLNYGVDFNGKWKEVK
jgi:hypothetical protein